MQKINQIAKINYESEADILMWEITNQPIDYAKDIGNVVVHFSKDNNPVLIEILEASKFLFKKQFDTENIIPVKKFTLALR